MDASGCRLFCFRKAGCRNTGRSTCRSMPTIAAPADLPKMIPVFPLPGALLLPRGQMPLNIFEPRYLSLVDDSLRDGHRLIGMIQPDESHSTNDDKPMLFHVGCVGRITQLAESRRRPLHSRTDRHLAVQGSGRNFGAHGVSPMRSRLFPLSSTISPHARAKRSRSRSAARRADGFSESQQSEGRLGRHRERAE